MIEHFTRDAECAEKNSLVMASHQGIALAMPKVLENQMPL
jgi:hypothetical protein